MRTIEIDDEVFDFLREKAEVFVDSPNTVLRRLLLKEGERASKGANSQSSASEQQESRKRTHEVSSEAFVRRCWKYNFSGVPRAVGRYRMMFESDSNIVYFQNFNKRGSPNLWYRLNPAPLTTMRASKKKAWVCFTNPAEGLSYIIPLDEIDKKVKSHGWDREEIEVNIDVADGRWREFDWRLDNYEVNVKDA